MKDFILKIWTWLKNSHRLQHYLLGIAYGTGANDTYCAIYGGVGVALALEWKDGQWGGKPDLIDAALTFAGVMTGYLLRTFIFKTLWN